MEKTTRKVRKEGQIDDFFILSTEWREETLTLTVIANNAAWAGQMNTAEVESMCKVMRKTKEEYIIELKHALSENEENFTFFIENETFVVKKTDHKSNIKMKFCIVRLHEIPLISTYMSLLTEVLDQENKNRGHITSLTHEVQYLKSEREDLMKRLQQFADEKASLETIFYSKFCQILNAKKEKIKSLESERGPFENTSTHHRNGKEQHIQSREVTIKNSSENQVFAEKECMVVDSSEDLLYTKRKDFSNTNAPPGPSSTTESDKTSNHYDSETDIDTDGESADNDPLEANLTSTASLQKMQEKDTTRILPKRGCASSGNFSVLPKRVHKSNVKSNYDREKDTQLPMSNKSNNEVNDEFNSQALLSEY